MLCCPICGAGITVRRVGNGLDVRQQPNNGACCAEAILHKLLDIAMEDA